MDISTLIPSVYDLFTAIGGFAFVYTVVKIVRSFWDRWKAAGADKDARIEALETALRELAEALDKRSTVSEVPKGAVG